MSLIPLWLKALIIAVLVAAIGLGVNAFLNHEQKIGWDKREAIAVSDELAMTKKHEAETDALQKEKDDAIAKRIELEKSNKILVAASTAVSVRLRDTIATLRQQLNQDSVETLRAYADTGLRLLGACQERYLDVATAAKGHLADEIMFDEAWPNEQK